MTDPAQPLFSLIVATVGEARDIGRLFDSLTRQTLQAFEVIVVDQNIDERLHGVITNYSDRLSIRRVRSEKGLSKARNRGIDIARSSILGFPDDDSWYYPDFLERLWVLFSAEPETAGLTGLCVDEAGHLAAGGGSRKPQIVTKATVWGLGVSAAMFMRRPVFDHIGGFDEDLGLGADTIFQSGEETDLMIRVIDAGFRLRYDPTLTVLHPVSDIYGPGAAKKSRAYGIGMGRVLRLHDYSLFATIGHLVKPAVGALLALSINRPRVALIRWERAKGRFEGWRWVARCAPSTFKGNLKNSIDVSIHDA